MLKLSEEAVFRWVLIVVAAAASVIALALLTSQLAGALWALALLGLGCAYAWRWWKTRP